MEQICVECMLGFCFTSYRRSPILCILPQPLLALPRVHVLQGVMLRGELLERLLREYEQSRLKSPATPVDVRDGVLLTVNQPYAERQRLNESFLLANDHLMVSERCMKQAGLLLPACLSQSPDDE